MASEARYRPKPVDGDIPEDEIPYVELFSDLADVIEDSGEAQRIVLLMSTCRNVWMTINAVFVDIRKVIGQEDLYDRLSRMIYLLERGEGSAALQARNEIGMILGQIAEKKDVWEERARLLGLLEETIDVRDGTSRSRLHHFLGRQKLHRSTRQSAHGHFLALELDTVPPRASELLDCLLEMSRRLVAICELAEALIPVSSALEPLFEARKNAQETFFSENPEALSGAVLETFSQAWPEVADVAASVAAADGEFPAERVQAFVDTEEEVERAAEALSSTLEAMRESVRREQKLLEKEFEPNAAIAPMPSPFVIDLSGADGDRRSHGRRFEVMRSTAEPGQERDTARIGLLCCGLPERAYRHTDPTSYNFGADDSLREEVVAAARAALEAAAEANCALLAMPEVFLPRGCVRDITALARERGIILVGGIEYRRGEDHRKAVNELVVAVPGLDPVHPRKQKPSVYEVREQDFESDGAVCLFRHTALGHLGVLVCSDYLEFDVLSALAEVPERLDVLIVCSRNPAPEVFATLAKADAARLYTAVVVVNVRPDADLGDHHAPSSSAGTVVALPTHEGTIEPLGDAIELPVNWSGDEPPSLAVYELPLARIRDRDRNRVTGKGFLPAPDYTRKIER